VLTPKRAAAQQRKGGCPSTLRDVKGGDLGSEVWRILQAKLIKFKL